LAAGQPHPEVLLWFANAVYAIMEKVCGRDVARSLGRLDPEFMIDNISYLEDVNSRE